MRWKRAVGLGFLSWLIPFAVSFVVFPLKKSNAPLFDNIMALAVVLTAALLSGLYSRRAAFTVRDAAIVGLLWAGLNLVLDYPMFAYGPMRMTPAAYYSDIGAAYLLYPAFTIGAVAVGRKPA